MKEVIKLKQQTPMWHFQHDESGCCLRATEVKPKLDKYLLEKEPGLKQFIFAGNALEYKLSFVAPESINQVMSNNSPLFFGNMGDWRNQKQLIFYTAPIEMHIFSFYDELVKTIKKHLCEFFGTHSFGTRQDKGFGFFFPEDKELPQSEFSNPFGAQYMFTVPAADYDSIFNHIYYFHKLIRSGINENKVYYKSLMYFYAKANNQQWDKPIIRHKFQLYTDVYKSICGIKPYTGENTYKVKFTVKEKIKDKDNKVKVIDRVIDKEFIHREEMAEEYRQCQSSKNKPQWLFREALGLASIQRWKDYNDTIKIAAINKEEDKDNKNFTRFKSPITYRPAIIGNKCIVYIHLDSRPIEDLKKQRFKITSTQNRETNIYGIKVYDKFTLENYFAYIENRYKNLVGNKELSITGEKRKKNKETEESEIIKIIEEIFKPFKGDNANFRKVK